MIMMSAPQEQRRITRTWFYVLLGALPASGLAGAAGLAFSILSLFSGSMLPLHEGRSLSRGYAIIFALACVGAFGLWRAAFFDFESGTGRSQAQVCVMLLVGLATLVFLLIDEHPKNFHLPWIVVCPAVCAIWFLAEVQIERRRRK